MRKLWIAWLALSFMASCTPYRMVGTTPEGAATIAIVAFENDSVESGVEIVVTRALRQGFLRRASTRLVADPGRADLILRGKVLPLATVSTSFSPVALSIEYSVTMELALELKTASGETVAIDEDSLHESELYLASADAEATRKNRQEALQRIADVLAARIRDALDLYLGGRERIAEDDAA